MYKPRTVEQFKVMEFIREAFQVECFLVSPVSRTCLMIEDGTVVQNGPKEEIFPQILANTAAGCSYLNEEAKQA